jgi:zinc-finger of the FCS-type, C2-C2
METAIANLVNNDRTPTRAILWIITSINFFVFFIVQSRSYYVTSHVAGHSEWIPWQGMNRYTDYYSNNWLVLFPPNIRGDLPFCSDECRQQQMDMDEEQEIAKSVARRALSRKELQKQEPQSSQKSQKARTGSIQLAG